MIYQPIHDAISAQSAILEGRARVLNDYLRMKADAGDHHGVADAACDLREIDAEQRGLAFARQLLWKTEAATPSVTP